VGPVNTESRPKVFGGFATLMTISEPYMKLSATNGSSKPLRAAFFRVLDDSNDFHRALSRDFFCLYYAVACMRYSHRQRKVTNEVFASIKPETEAKNPFLDFRKVRFQNS